MLTWFSFEYRLKEEDQEDTKSNPLLDIHDCFRCNKKSWYISTKYGFWNVLGKTKVLPEKKHSNQESFVINVCIIS